MLQLKEKKAQHQVTLFNSGWSLKFLCVNAGLFQVFCIFSGTILKIKQFWPNLRKMFIR